MSLVQFKIEVEPYNGRSNQIAIKLVVTNTGEDRVRLISLTPNVPIGVEIEERRDISQESKKEKAIDLCLQLTEILNNHLLINYENVKEEIIAINKEMFNEIFASPQKVLMNSISIIKHSVVSQEVKRINTKLDSMNYKIQSLEDAQWAYDKWFSHLGDDNVEKSLYEGKLQQLKNLEEKMGENESNVLALIEATSSYTRSYVIKFKRKLFSPKIFNITIDGLYSQDKLNGEYRVNVSEPVTISPQPFALTFLAVLSSIMGSILKYNLEHPKVSDSFLSYTNELFTYLSTGYGVSSAIVAIVFFNIYEHINFGDFGKKISSSPNGQVALLIGALSGLMGDKIVKALNVFIGI
ncbi:hypothetical protein CON85_12265 [Bacillus toyonensis]|uniref:hypothetical protein n=1 Tax=Bacillus cereus group TaxID=86661 RepID=UPI000BEC56AA|nr:MULTISPECIES: hypothetical protein [Bacillus cereus group]MDC6159386.1 hypothetical protein [Bacillus albus]MDD8008863.1 hypothetical protein [Bacillus albus]PDZ28255.1 hypothetical protein CON85_12265 [Bacillus toyonensis]